MSRKNHSALVLLYVILAHPAWAQTDQSAIAQANSGNFNLFESLDNNTSNNASSAPGRNNASERGTRNTQANPTFVLVGTSKVGNQRSALLKHLNGDVLRVPLTDSTNPIPGHELYSVLSQGAGRISVRFPDTVPCTEFPEQGVTCESGTNAALLSLTTAAAVVTAQEEPLQDENAEQVASEESGRNPFEAIRERGRAANPDQSTRFQPRRIDPADVPPGMRVVSTPFGDRLVQQ